MSTSLMKQYIDFGYAFLMAGLVAVGFSALAFVLVYR